MGAIASQITSLTIVYSTVYSDADQRSHQSSASLAFVWGIHRGPVNSPHKWPVTRKMFPFDDVIMVSNVIWYSSAIVPAHLSRCCCCIHQHCGLLSCYYPETGITCSRHNFAYVCNICIYNQNNIYAINMCQQGTSFTWKMSKYLIEIKIHCHTLKMDAYHMEWSGIENIHIFPYICIHTYIYIYIYTFHLKATNVTWTYTTQNATRHITRMTVA